MDSDRKIVVELFNKLRCYLIGDITAMLHIAPIGGCGACGYPILQTIISGSELCGRLELGLFKKESGEEPFKHFVTKYMPPMYEPLSRLYGPFRNTPAHMFITSVKIFKETKRHMIVPDGDLEIDVTELSNDFLIAFEKFSCAVISSEDREIALFRKNIDLLQKKLLGEAKKIVSVFSSQQVIEQRTYHYKTFQKDPQNLTSSDVTLPYQHGISGPSTLTHDQAKALDGQ